MLTSIDKYDKQQNGGTTVRNEKAGAQQITGFGFFADLIKQTSKKRKRVELSGNNGGNTGKFIYKFKEGHSKNFKRKLDFDYFL